MNILLLILIFFVGIYPIYWETRNKSFDFFNLKNPFIIYFIIQLGLSGTVTLITGVVSDEIGLDPAQYSSAYEKALLASLLALTFFQIGYYSFPACKFIKLPRICYAQWNHNRIKWLVLLYFACGYLSFYIFLVINGGLAEFMINREAWRSGELVGQGFLTFPSSQLLVLAALIYFIQMTAEGGLSKIKSIIIFVAALIPTYLIGFRSTLLMPMLQIMLLYNYHVKIISVPKLVAGLTFIVLSFTAYGIVREIPYGIPIDFETVADTIEKNPELIYTVISRSKGTEVVASVINKLDETGDFDGVFNSLFEAATIIIPQKIWADKPQASSFRFTTYFFADDFRYARGYDREAWGGISPTSVGHFYWQMGWFGVVIGHFILGWIARIAYNTVQKNMKNPNILLAYAIFYSSFAMFAESIQGYLNGLVMSGIALIITYTIMQITFKPVLRQREQF